jgi:hypothetical protein
MQKPKKAKKPALPVFPLLRALYEHAVTWTAPDQLYGFQQANQDFKNCVYYNSYRSSLEDSVLRVTLAPWIVGPAGGTMSKFKLPEAASYSIAFDLKFDKDFYFGAGGKVGFGLLVGPGYTGGDTGPTGGSVRLMWQGNYLKPYVYHPRQLGTRGDDFGKRFPVVAGQWYNVKITVTPSTVKIEINGEVLLSQVIQFNDVVKHLSFENFRGGSEAYWQSPKEDKIYFDNVVISQLD